MNQLLYILLGFSAGTFSGIFGIGGAIILIPVLVYLFGFPQHLAQGTSIVALLPPVGLLAAMRYYQSGNVKVAAAILICIGFFFGGLLGAEIALRIPTAMLKKLFGALLLLIALNMIFRK
jgi:uncharacterized membrane protein YfcA